MGTQKFSLGFRKKPRDLDVFLLGQGYFPSAISSEIKFYDYKTNIWPNITYISDYIQGQDDFPDWSEFGRKISSLLEIEAPFNDSEAISESHRLSRQIVRHFNAILYDPFQTRFLTKADIGREVN